ncbi:hypothetical protein BDP27DRAFT_1367351 [Rhodocollybia butyracea]|uniref:Uncharacterized protein n=1 Tax=Rhodocollybia butyracea TaxID=206335 RepID=A0A9P5PJ74_9AGAR|nr:hypothetical protein BDP27DRAFT_1367351 [Rhodocollybia butyracea]
MFILNRYSFMLYAVMQLACLFSRNMTDIGCRDLDFTASLVFGKIMVDSMTKLLSILRVYALFGQKRSLFILLCPFIIADIVVGFLHYCGIIFSLTLARTARHIMQSRKSGIRSVAEVVLRDASLIIDRGSVALSGQVAHLPNVLINRFVLNLRAYSNRTQHSGKSPSTNATAPSLGRLSFAESRFIGNMGAPLDPRVDPLTTLVPVIYDYEKGAQLVLCLRGGEAGGVEKKAAGQSRDIQISLNHCVNIPFLVWQLKHCW